ncbi:hypothetical protein Plhal304r1_c004g0017931 [Plasmopara halstedii]
MLQIPSLGMLRRKMRSVTLDTKCTLDNCTECSSSPTTTDARAGGSLQRESRALCTKEASTRYAKILSLPALYKRSLCGRRQDGFVNEIFTVFSDQYDWFDRFPYFALLLHKQQTPFPFSDADNIGKNHRRARNEPQSHLWRKSGSASRAYAALSATVGVTFNEGASDYIVCFDRLDLSQATLHTTAKPSYMSLQIHQRAQRAPKELLSDSASQEYRLRMDQLRFWKQYFS